MKKTLRFFGMVMMTMLLSACFTSCGDEDNDFDSDLVGRWDYVDHDTSYSEYVEFTKDGKFYFVETYGSQQFIEEGTWWTNGNKLYIKSYDEEDEEYYTSWAYYSIEGEYLYTWDPEDDKSEADIYRRHR